jgi:hypothetical protein
MFSHKKPAEKLPLSNTFSDAFTNEVFVRKETWLQRNNQMDERCERQNAAFIELRDGQEAIERKISATLVFVIVTLAGVITALVLGK